MGSKKHPQCDRRTCNDEACRIVRSSVEVGSRHLKEKRETRKALLRVKRMLKNALNGE